MVLIAVVGWTRPLMPIDETRYVTVAWEMWVNENFLVPFLNGQPYSHKPPLLFWLMQAGWWIFGVNDWWPRLVAPLIGLANVYLTQLMAVRLWPEQQKTAKWAPLIFLGCLLTVVYLTLTLFDSLVVFFTLLGLLGVVQVWREHKVRGWILLGASMGFGILAKGPVIFLYTLPVALLAPWWIREERPSSYFRWYFSLSGAVLLGAAIALVWALPAAQAGGEEYSKAIFWHQTMDRVVDSFAHVRSPWWYLALSPVIVFPWFFWPPVWRALRKVPARISDSGIRFCLAWMVPAFLGLAAISGKQVHYVLPIVPAFALIAGRLLADPDIKLNRNDQAILGAFMVILSVPFFAITWAADQHLIPSWVKVPYLVDFAILAGGIALRILPLKDMDHGIRQLTLVSFVLIVALHFGGMGLLQSRFNLKEISKHAGDFQAQGYDLAHFGKYEGQFHFLGRLEKPMDVIHAENALEWVEQHPHGKMIIYCRNIPYLTGHSPDYTQLFGVEYLTLWDNRTVRSHPYLTLRCGGRWISLSLRTLLLSEIQ